MYIILIYDINTETKEGKRRLTKVMKKCRQYLHHTQKSVFEGEITEAKLMELTLSIKKMISNELDYIVIYKIENLSNLERINIGIDYDPTSNII